MLNPCWTSLVAQKVKHLPTMRETWVQSPGWENPLEKEVATHSSSLTWKIHGWRSLVGYSPWGCKEWDTTELLHFFTFFNFFHSSMKQIGLTTASKGEEIGFCNHFCSPEGGVTI